MEGYIFMGRWRTGYVEICVYNSVSASVRVRRGIDGPILAGVDMWMKRRIFLKSLAAVL